MTPEQINTLMSFNGHGMSIHVIHTRYDEGYAAFMCVDEDCISNVLDSLCNSENLVDIAVSKRFPWFPIAFAKDHKEAIDCLYEKLKTIEIDGEAGRAWVSAVMLFAQIVAPDPYKIKGQYDNYIDFLNAYQPIL